MFVFIFIYFYMINQVCIRGIIAILCLQGFVAHSFADKVSGPMLPDPMDIIEETSEPLVVHTTSVAATRVAAVSTQPSQNICKGTSTNGQWYRRCDMVGTNASLTDIAANIRCEHFYFSRYAFDALDASVSRRNVSVLALSMARNNSKPISITQEPQYKNLQNDLRSPMFPWTKPMVESDLDRNIVTNQRTIFEPSRFITRSEAISMLMASVCLYPKAGEDKNWQKNMYEVAYQNGITTQSWKTFTPNKNISVRELALVTSRVADWAEKTGGCTLKPVQCVK